jgi:hypothetical protein
MATSGRKPTPTYLKLLLGNPGRRRIRPSRTSDPMPGGPVERPKKITKAAAALWDDWIARAPWLTWADSPKAFMWCNLQAEFLKSAGKMSASRIAQLRALGGDLGLDLSRFGQR